MKKFMMLVAVGCLGMAMATPAQAQSFAIGLGYSSGPAWGHAYRPVPVQPYCGPSLYQPVPFGYNRGVFVPQRSPFNSPYHYAPQRFNQRFDPRFNPRFGMGPQRSPFMYR